MRPISLRIQAFGSFADREHVRFDTLAEVGLFVVTGPTGSGKTTIFDAMAMALYGRVAGDRPVDVRSHHAVPGTETEVELEFEVERRRYRVWRKPAQERPKHRGGGMRTIPPAAELYEWMGEGWQGIASQPTRVTERCTELVGLDLEQFQRVVLLPQGKFAEFLLSDTTKRQELLRQLFGSSLYLAATEWYQDEARRLQSDVAQFEQLITHHRTNALEDVRDVQRQIPPAPDGTLFSLDPEPLADDATLDEIDAALLACVPQLEVRQREQAEREAAHANAAHQATVGRDAAKRFDRHAELVAQRKVLTGRQAGVEQAAERASRARAVLPVVAADELATAARAAATAACRSEHRRRHVVVTGCAELGIDPPASPAVASAALAVHGTRLAAQLEQLDAVVAARAELAARACQLDRAIVEMNSAEQGVAAAVAARSAAEEEHAAVVVVAARLDAALAAEAAARVTCEQRHRLDELVVVLDAARRTVEARSADEQRLVQQFASGVAPRLAAELRAGEPCVVCGSREHPQPAVHGEDVEPVGLDQLAAARDAVDVARDRASAVIAEITVLQRALGTLATDDVAEVQRRRDAAARDAQAARDAADRLPSCERRVRHRADAHEAAIRARDAARIDLAGATARHDAATREVADRAASVAELSEDDVRAAAARVAALESDVAAWAGALADHTRVLAELERAEAELERCLVTSGLDDVAAAAAVALEPEEIGRLEQQAAAWQADVTAVDERLAELVQQGVPPVRPDVDALAERARVLSIDATAMGTVITRIEQRCHDARLAIDHARRITTESASLRAEYDVARTVMLTCTGQLGQRVMFETWVLAAELDRVTEAATIHLQRMSAGRYALRRGDSAIAGNRRTGLDLLVFDAHTGRERVPATLSGGERFQASLALALGLADVVSQGGTGSGRVFEALFVDEGFGSLDPDALDDAIEALQHLQATGRMVGVITHVEAMKQQLRTGIEVRLREDGRGARIVQGLDLRSAR